MGEGNVVTAVVVASVNRVLIQRTNSRLTFVLRLPDGRVVLRQTKGLVARLLEENPLLLAVAAAVRSDFKVVLDLFANEWPF